MAGITSAITIEDRFSKTISLFTKLISGSIGPVEAVTSGMSIFGKSIKDLVPFVMDVYSKFEDFQGSLGLTEMAFHGIIDKAGGVYGILSKVAMLFPQLQPFVEVFSSILEKLRAGEGVLSIGVGFITQMQLPFAGVVKSIMAVRDFLNSDLAKLIKSVAIGGAIVFTLKGIWGGLKLVEANAPKALGRLSALFVVARGKAINLHASMMLSNTKSALLYQKAMRGLVKFGVVFGGLKSKLMNFHASMMLSDTKAAMLYQKPFQSIPKLGGMFNKAKAKLLNFHASMMLSDTKAASLYQKPFEALSKFKDSALYGKAVAGIKSIALGFSALKIKIFSAVGMHGILIKSLIAKYGFTRGIEAYIGCLRIMTKQFAIAKLAALKTFILMKAEAIKTFITTTLASKGWFKTMKGGLKTIATEARSLFSKLPGIVKAGFAVYGIIGAVKAIKSAFTGMMNVLDNAKEKVDELITKTAEIERSRRFVMRFGEDAAKQFTTMATKMSLSMGIAKSEIMDANTAFKNMGVSDKTNAELTKLAARFSTLNENADFSSVANSFAEAIKSGSADGLGEMFNGNPRALKEMKRKHLDRLLDRGRIEEFITGMNEIAEKFGYTQKKADELMNTPQGKLKRISANIDRLSEKMKATFTTAILPYIEKFLALIESPEFQENFEKVRRQVTSIIELFGGMVEKVVDFGIAAYKWWIEPTTGMLRNVMIFFAVAGMFTKLISIIKGVAISSGLIGKALRLSLVPLKGIKAGIIGMISGFNAVRAKIKGNTVEMNRFKSAVKATAFAGKTALTKMVLSPGIVFTGVAILIAKGCQALVEKLTGESHGLVEDFVRVVVPGFITGMLNIRNFFVGTWLEIRTVIGAIISGLVSVLEFHINNMINALITAIVPLVGIAQGVSRLASHITGEDYTLIPTIELPKMPQFDQSVRLLTDDEIFEKAQGAFESAMDSLPGIMKTAGQALDLLGLGSLEDYMADWKSLNDMNGIEDLLNEQNGNLKGIRRNTGDMKKAMDLQWMKELAEQRFVNNVNVRQLTPTVNVKVSGTNSTPQEIGAELAVELQQMADAGTFNAYGAMA